MSCALTWIVGPWIVALREWYDHELCPYVNGRTMNCMKYEFEYMYSYCKERIHPIDYCRHEKIALVLFEHYNNILTRFGCSCLIAFCILHIHYSFHHDIGVKRPCCVNTIISLCEHLIIVWTSYYCVNIVLLCEHRIIVWTSYYSVNIVLLCEHRIIDLSYILGQLSRDVH